MGERADVPVGRSAHGSFLELIVERLYFLSVECCLLKEFIHDPVLVFHYDAALREEII